jgi:hypothetical protein
LKGKQVAEQHRRGKNYLEKHVAPDLPDGRFTCPKSEFGHILEALNDTCWYLFYGYLEHFAILWHIL